MEFNAVLESTGTKTKDIFTHKGKKYYDKDLATGKTSRTFKDAAPGLKMLFDKKHFKEDDTILDYGAGKIGRNAAPYRKQGYKIYAYDKFHKYGDDGWTGVAQTIPKTKFDAVFSCFVLNVVTKRTELEILKDAEKQSKKVYHIVRNSDITDMLKKSLKGKKGDPWDFYINEYEGDPEAEITKELIDKFAEFGVKTSNGLQRVVYLEDEGYKEVKAPSKNYKVYEKN